MTYEEAIKIAIEALDLNNRQQAEIERLGKRIADVSKTIKSEAVKEFAERMKAIYPPRDDKRCTLDDCYVLDYIDSIVKEMVGETE